MSPQPKSGPEICTKLQLKVWGGVKPGVRQQVRIPAISAPTQPFQISLGRVAIVYPFQEIMSSPTNEIKASAKLPSMPFPYLVTLLILLPPVDFIEIGQS
jgi:hypothetical protein